MNYTPLFQPISVGPLRLKNRFVMAPMSVHMTEDGSVSDAEIAYTERRAMGGVSMIIVGSLCIWPDGNFGGQIFIHDDGCIPGLRRLTEAVHRHDCLIAAQLHHAGRETNARTSGFQPVAPSYFEPETHSVFKAEYDAPRVLETREVEQYVEYYAQAVRRAKEAGFDACELHCAHGYLICAFMSPLSGATATAAVSMPGCASSRKSSAAPASLWARTTPSPAASSGTNCARAASTWSFPSASHGTSSRWALPR